MFTFRAWVLHPVLGTCVFTSIMSSCWTDPFITEIKIHQKVLLFWLLELVQPGVIEYKIWPIPTESLLSIWVDKTNPHKTVGDLTIIECQILRQRLYILHEFGEETTLRPGLLQAHEWPETEKNILWKGEFPFHMNCAFFPPDTPTHTPPPNTYTNLICKQTTGF